MPLREHPHFRRHQIHSHSAFVKSGYSKYQLFMFKLTMFNSVDRISSAHNGFVSLTRTCLMRASLHMYLLPLAAAMNSPGTSGSRGTLYTQKHWNHSMGQKHKCTGKKNCFSSRTIVIKVSCKLNPKSSGINHY